MPRCFVAIDRTGSADVGAALRKACDAMALGGSRERAFRIVRAPFAALVLSHDDVSPFCEGDGEILIDLGVGPTPPSFTDFLEDCAGYVAAATERPPSLPRHLVGRRSLMRWSPSRQELLIVAEPNGQLPLFFSTLPGRTYVASEPKAIWAAEPGPFRPDVDGLLELCRVGQLLGERTLFREIRRVAAGALMSFRPDGLRTRPYHPLHFSDARQSDPGLAEELNRSLDLVLRDYRKAVPRATVALSGGMDSRYLLAAATGVWEGLDSITFGEERSLDVSLARAIAGVAHVPHRHLAPAPDFLSRWAGYAVWRTDGMLSCLHAHGMDAIIACSGQSRHILNGMGGDLLMGAFLRAGHLLWPGDPVRAARFVAGRSQPAWQSPEQVFKPEVLAQATASPEATLVEIMRRYPHERLGNVLLCFWLRHRCAHVTAAGLTLEAPYVEYLTPLVDPSFVLGASRLPLEARFMSRTHRRALALLAPDLTRVCWERVGFAPRWPWPVLALGKLGRRLRLLSRPRPAVDFTEQFRSTLLPWLEGLLLDPATLEDGYFLPDYLRSLLLEHARRQGDRTSQIGMAVTVELWRRLFMDRDLAIAAPPGGEAAGLEDSR